MFSFLSSGESKSSVAATPSLKPAILLVVVPNKKVDYAQLFDGHILQDGRPIEVVQAMWSEFLVSSYVDASGTKCLVSLSPGRRTFQPDFLLIRSEVRGVTADQDYRNTLFGLMYANIPSVNSLHSVYCFLERPVVQAELNRLQSQLGSEVFPVVEQSYFASHREMFYGSKFPAVAKMGHAHAGYGKMKVADHHAMDDFRSVLALTSCYVTAEPFIEGSYDLRVQKIGSHLRAFKRESMCGSWKTNMGSSHLEEVEVTDTFRVWAEEASHMFGGLDICTVDAIHDSKTGKDLIMEVNGTASGFAPDRTAEDNGYVRDLVIEKMNYTLCTTTAGSS
jgi:synapsin